MTAANPQVHRLGLLVGEEALAALEQKRVIVFGLGGVGSWAAEALVRSGIGHITIVDSDSVCVTNINRQVEALPLTVGLPKAAVLMKRLLDINPHCDVKAFNKIFSRETAPFFEIEKADYVIDAIDSLTHKLDLIEITAGKNPAGDSEQKSPILFSCMGMACKLDPTRIKTADIWKSSGCPLARLVRQGLKKRNFAGNFTVVYSDERIPRMQGVETLCGTDQCLCANKETEWCSSKKVINGSIVTVTATAGMILASLVINDAVKPFLNESAEGNDGAEHG
jgi:tRNA A37 threonylcarbamoyladenosine dehydratase